MSSDLKSAINTALQTIMDPYLETDLVSAKAIKRLEIKETTVLLKITLGYPAKSYESELKKTINHTLKALAGITAIDITVDYEIASHAVQKQDCFLPLPHLNIIPSHAIRIQLLYRVRFSKLQQGGDGFCIYVCVYLIKRLARYWAQIEGGDYNKQYQRDYPF